MSAAVVEPVGRNAYWFLRFSATQGVCSAGYIIERVSNFSITRDNTGVIDMGRKSAHLLLEALWERG